MSLLSGIVLVYLGGGQKKNSKTRKVYLSLFAAGGVFMILSAILSIEAVSGFIFPLGVTFVASGCVVLISEAIFVWRLSIRGGRKAIV